MKSSGDPSSDLTTLKSVYKAVNGSQPPSNHIIDKGTSHFVKKNEALRQSSKERLTNNRNGRVMQNIIAEDVDAADLTCVSESNADTPKHQLDTMYRSSKNGESKYGGNSP